MIKSGCRPSWAAMAESLSVAYAVLGLADGASWDDVRAAHRRLAKQLHPDVAGGDSARMSEINVAFAALAAARHTMADPAATEPSPDPPPAPSEDDPVTFSVNVLPVEAFEALLVATSFLGDPWV